jgi:hypothetical protein
MRQIPLILSGIFFAGLIASRHDGSCVYARFVLRPWFVESRHVLLLELVAVGGGSETVCFLINRAAMVCNETTASKSKNDPLHTIRYGIKVRILTDCDEPIPCHGPTARSGSAR